jgi:hypothetical protein
VAIVDSAVVIVNIRLDTSAIDDMLLVLVEPKSCVPSLIFSLTLTVNVPAVTVVAIIIPYLLSQLPRSWRNT